MARNVRKAAWWNFLAVGTLFLLALLASRSWNAPGAETVRLEDDRIDTPIAPAIPADHHPRQLSQNSSSISPSTSAALDGLRDRLCGRALSGNMSNLVLSTK